MSDAPLACNPGAFEPAERERHRELRRRLLGATPKVAELSHGYAMRFWGDAALWGELAEFVALERRCCPFLSFALRLEAEPAEPWPVILELTGGAGVKDFLWAEFALG